MFPKTDKIPWICFRERAGTKNTDMTFIHSTRAILKQLFNLRGPKGRIKLITTVHARIAQEVERERQLNGCELLLR